MREEPPAAFTHRPHESTGQAGSSPDDQGALAGETIEQIRGLSIEGRHTYDPLPLCIYTTIGIISWLVTPPLTVAIFGSLGVAGYVRARRRGLARSRCKLGDTRLVIAYLGVAAIAGAAVTISRIAGLFS
jgi:hypothetical protein